MDTFSPQKRHEIMASIHSTETAPEKTVRVALHKIGFRFRKNDARFDGKPDIVLPHFNAMIFVHGCFWHGHDDCAKFRLPKSNAEYWRTKIARNKERDAKTVQKLLTDGWRVGIVWECAITGKNKDKIQTVVDEISLWLEEDVGDSFRVF